MNAVRKSIIIGMTVLGLGGTALAVQAHEGQGARHEQMKAKWGERAAKRSAALHDTLKLTPAQEAAWSTYSAAIKPAPRPERTAGGERGAWKSAPAPERMARHIERSRQRLAMMEARLAATTSFYGVLTPEQKKLFDDASLQRGGQHRGKHRMHG